MDINSEYIIEKDDSFQTKYDVDALPKVYDNLTSHKTIYNGVLSVINNLQPIAIFCAQSNDHYERELIKLMNESDIKFIPLEENAWIIYKDNAYIKNVIYIYSLFSKNKVQLEIESHMTPLSKYRNYGVCPYKYVHGTLMEFPDEEIRGSILHGFIEHKLITNDNDIDNQFREQLKNCDSIFVDPSFMDDAIQHVKNELESSNGIILFDSMYDLISRQCDKILQYFFSESNIFDEFFMENKDKIVTEIKLMRPKIKMPKIIDREVDDLLNPHSKRRSYYHNNMNNSYSHGFHNTTTRWNALHRPSTHNNVNLLHDKESFQHKSVSQPNMYSMWRNGNYYS
jgi:hypothetical protein